jgi:hypothetical protein
MPQLVVLALVGAGLYAGYRWYARASERVAAEVRRTEDELRRRAQVAVKEMGKLEYDPISGVYRPSNRG